MPLMRQRCTCSYSGVLTCGADSSDGQKLVTVFPVTAYDLINVWRCFYYHVHGCCATYACERFPTGRCRKWETKFSPSEVVQRLFRAYSTHISCCHSQRLRMPKSTARASIRLSHLGRLGIGETVTLLMWMRGYIRRLVDHGLMVFVGEAGAACRSMSDCRPCVATRCGVSSIELSKHPIFDDTRLMKTPGPLVNSESGLNTIGQGVLMHTVVAGAWSLTGCRSRTASDVDRWPIYWPLGSSVRPGFLPWARPIEAQAC